MYKAIIQEIINKYTATVRIPFYHKAEGVAGAIPNELLPVATMIVHPDEHFAYHKGDVVYIDFEDGLQSKPVIIGKLYNED